MQRETLIKRNRYSGGYVRKPDLLYGNMRWLRTCENRVDTLFAGDKT